ncbi:MAG TPA: DUF6755 family protein [Dehalococcoidia bacterium]|nr:DUF6755 family protein [Dehalococcoidia bacterium]
MNVFRPRPPWPAQRDERETRTSSMPSERGAPHGVEAVVATLVAIGIVLLAIQLWLLTVALDIYLGGNRGELWVLALLSGLVFLGGLAAVRLIGRLSRMGRRP